MSHLFLTSPIAQKLRGFFAICAGIHVEGEQLQQTINRWWFEPAPTKLRYVYKAIPHLLMWELWKRRNNRRHGKEVSYECMSQQVLVAVHRFVKGKYPWITLPNEWNGIIHLLKNYKPKIHWKAVRWELPEQGWIKCNADGACRGNPGESAYAFCIRNSSGDLIEAEAGCMGITTSMEAETIAILMVLRKCRDLRLQNIILETDSISLRNIILKDWKIPWKLSDQIEEIKHHINESRCIMKHVFREANQVADKLANITLNQQIPITVSNFTQLPKECRVLMNIDKAQISTLRIKTMRININIH
ncbi:hypothetical protein KY290_036536 [Solanum tuberosum]|uniref:RNase H type-1 domain-containing protein n=1 Tax=Solanum tuberosum TaxID=4113 RepID=A0ABQ7TSZ2_SOLTU|nr:hypothetical protein KY289_036023 [Solanum tuberosum]KAH0639264.1 hypothetical protein KY285_035850 [Solanum tuberosum]KAH0737831.1 hypothetical protein KY290_036536 [Solanum tuberosum]